MRMDASVALLEDRRIRPALWLALASLALHAVGNGNYGIFRDELYFVVCGNHPDWGYADQPAVVPLLASWSHALFGDSLLGFRLLPAIMMSATIALTAEFVRVIGGGRFAQWLAGCSVLLAPIYLIEGVLFFTDMFQGVTWLGLGWVLVRLEQSQDERWWLAFGAIVGLSLNTKYTIVFYVAALGVGLIATPLRRSLSRPWLYAGALLAGALVLPNVLWQAAHEWPFIELGKAAAGGKNIVMSPLEFFRQQLMLTTPWVALIWLFGLWVCLVKPPLQVARAFPVAWLLLLLFFATSHGKPYYLVAVYPTLLAFGAVSTEWHVRTALVRRSLLAGIIGLGVLAMPFGLPILPVETFIRYEKAIGLIPSTGERQAQAELPQYYADMFGWQDMAQHVAAVYHALPEADRARAVFYGENYGEAAAIDVFGQPLGLPPAISGHNNYYLWGPRGHDGSVLIVVGGNAEHYAQLFGSVTVAGQITTRYAMPFETDVPIYVLRDMKQPLVQYWPSLKKYR